MWRGSASAAMTGHTKRDGRAERQAQQALLVLGREIELARLNHDLSQAAAGRAMGISAASWSRLERGRSTYLPLVTLARALAVVGLDLHIRAYPGGHVVRDTAHLQLLERLRSVLGSTARWRTEVPLPNPGDRRAWDALIQFGHLRIGVEAETRARDAQELQRRLALKQRDGGVDRLILLLADTRHNRDFLRGVGAGFLADFPVSSRQALDRLAVSADPGGNAIVLL